MLYIYLSVRENSSLLMVDERVERRLMVYPVWVLTFLLNFLSNKHRIIPKLQPFQTISSVYHQSLRRTWITSVPSKLLKKPRLLDTQEQQGGSGLQLPQCTTHTATLYQAGVNTGVTRGWVESEHGNKACGCFTVPESKHYHDLWTLAASEEERAGKWKSEWRRRS